MPLPHPHPRPSRVAACSCGQLQAHVAGEPLRVSVCHCLACQRRTGSVFGAQARFARETVSIVGASTEYVRTGDGGSECTFRFCPACGATVYYTLEHFPEVIAIPVGAFADASFPAPSISVYEERMHAWVHMPTDIDHRD
ncbi:MAG: GFA family protein [Betaproteobacteria bacterium]|nr:GFA family protein [Betaproteobacteria bacterium]